MRRTYFVPSQQVGFGRVPTPVAGSYHVGFGRVPPAQYSAQGGDGFLSGLAGMLKNAFTSDTAGKFLKYGLKHAVTPIAQTAVQAAILRPSAPPPAIDSTPNTTDVPVVAAPPQGITTAELTSALKSAMQSTRRPPTRRATGGRSYPTDYIPGTASYSYPKMPSKPKKRGRQRGRGLWF